MFCKNAELTLDIKNVTATVVPLPFLNPHCYQKPHKTSSPIRKIDQTISHCSNIPKLKHSKKFITISVTMIKSLVDFSKNDLSIITALFSGGGPLRYHFRMMGRLASDICRFCSEQNYGSRIHYVRLR